MRCQLCRLVYPNFELSNLVSLHMLITYKQHAVKRRDLPWDTSHLKFATKDQLSQCVRVCQYCYLLLTTELDLIEVSFTQTERSLALMVGIPCSDQSLIEDPRLKIQLQFLPKQMMQWRVLCLLEHFSNSKLGPMKGLCLAYKFCDDLTFFPIDDCSARRPLNCMKVSYFYHQESRHPRQFFESLCPELRLTQGSDWKKWIAKSNIALLKDFPYDLPKQYAMAQSMHSVLFDRRQEPVVTVSLKAGVSADHLVNSQNIKSIMAKHSDIYIPERHYCTTDPLPAEWMELFDYFDEDLSADEDIEKDIYVPILSQAEMQRMEDMTNPLKKLKRAPVDPNHVPFHRCCAAHKSGSKEDLRHTRLQKPTSTVPKLSFGEMQESTSSEVKHMHSTVSEYLFRRPNSANIKPDSASFRPTSANTLKPHRSFLKRGVTERTGASTNRSSYVSNSLSSIATPNSRRKAFDRHLGLINQYTGELQ